MVMNTVLVVTSGCGPHTYVEKFYDCNGCGNKQNVPSPTTGWWRSFNVNCEKCGSKIVIPNDYPVEGK